MGTHPKISHIALYRLQYTAPKYRSLQKTVTLEALTLILKHPSFLHTCAISLAFLVNLFPSFFKTVSLSWIYAVV